MPMIASPRPKKVKRAFIGVRRVECTLPMADGSKPSRPALKISRAWEFVPAIRAPRVEVMPARKAKNNKTAKPSLATEMKGMAELPRLETLSLNPTTVEKAKKV